MANHTTYILLDTIVNDYLAESEQSNHKYWKNWNLAFRCMDMLGLDFFYTIKTVKLQISANLTATLPPDYLNWTKCGILNDSGGIIPLTHNNNLTNFADLDPERLSKINDPESAWLEWGWGNTNTWCNYWNGWNYVNIYGVPSGEPFVGSFKIDTANGVILLNESFNREYLMLEYVSSPTPQLGNDYRVPVQFREAMIAWLWWKDGNAKSIKSHMELGNRRDWRHEFYNERRNAIARWKPIRLQEQYQTSQEMSRLAVKT